MCVYMVCVHVSMQCVYMMCMYVYLVGVRHRGQTPHVNQKGILMNLMSHHEEAVGSDHVFQAPMAQSRPCLFLEG